MRIIILFTLTIASCMARPEVADPANQVLFDFSNAERTGDWRVQNDVVMGGRSESTFGVTAEGHGRFSGHVSLENNGGFASIVTELPESVDLSPNSSFQLLVLGDGKTYTFRVRAREGERFYYQADFPTQNNEKWETIGIPFGSMRPVFRGEALDRDNFAGDQAVGFQLLIGNKKEEDFEIQLARIEAI